MNEIAVIEQLPIITEQIKEVGKQLDKRLEELNLDKLVCNDETRKSIKNLRTEIGNELKSFEEQRKNIKKKINEPYEAFNKTYEEEIKTKYQNADLILKNKIDVVEAQIKNNAKVLAVEFFEEYKKSKTLIRENYIKYDELNLQLGLDSLTDKGALVKKVKDTITEKLDALEKDIETINTMQNNDEILVEYLKHKNLSLAIKEVNDRHTILEQVQRDYAIVKKVQKQEEKVIEKVETILEAPVVETLEGQMTIDDFADEIQEELVEAKFKVITTESELRFLVNIMKERKIKYESITD